MYFELHLISRIVYVLPYSRYNPDSEHFAPNTKHAYRWFLQEARSIILCNKDLGLLSDSLSRCRCRDGCPFLYPASPFLTSFAFCEGNVSVLTPLILVRRITLRAALVSNTCSLSTESSRQSPMRSLTIGDFAHGNSLRLIWYSARSPYLRVTAPFSTCAFRVDKLSYLPLPRCARRYFRFEYVQRDDKSRGHKIYMEFHTV